jgi:hypothetical protein
MYLNLLRPCKVLQALQGRKNCIKQGYFNGLSVLLYVIV